MKIKLGLPEYKYFQSDFFYIWLNLLGTRILVYSSSTSHIKSKGAEGKGSLQQLHGHKLMGESWSPSLLSDGKPQR